jgi:hypothetical protein
MDWISEALDITLLPFSVEDDFDMNLLSFEWEPISLEED